MDINLKTPSQSFLNQLLPFLLSFVDDALLLGLSHFGFHLQWLKWLSPVIMIYTVLYWTVQLMRYFSLPIRQFLKKHFCLYL
ncbi:hypothetical protein DP117_30975 [Brasilonema sp. UFV-L1]|nr:hypothetical protein [Brasilonema sp. UFV-L1]